jgi:hypothetical protein
MSRKLPKYPEGLQGPTTFCKATLESAKYSGPLDKDLLLCSGKQKLMQMASFAGGGAVPSVVKHAVWYVIIDCCLSDREVGTIMKYFGLL